MSFTLGFARTLAVTEAVPTFAYDANQQLSVLSDGTPAVAASSASNVVALYNTTTSTAGSKTHFDD